MTLDGNGIDADVYLKGIEDSLFFHRYEAYESSLSTSEIVAIVLGSIIVVVVIILGVFCFVAPDCSRSQESSRLLDEAE